MPLQYRVVETVPNGYTPAYNPAQISGDSATDASANNVAISNTLITVSLAGSKTWNDQNQQIFDTPRGASP